MSEKKFFFMTALVFCICGVLPAAIQAMQYKVLVVMSYDDGYDWDIEIREGIDSVLSDTCEIRYFYMDTKRNLAQGEEKAKAAYELYREFQPDGVITADDNAQSMFVVPYLKDKVKTPVMFCGVNAAPQDYGFPASNVSGILERMHIRESIAFVQELIPSVRTVGYITKDSPSSKALLAQLKSEKETYPVRSEKLRIPKTLNEALETTKMLRKTCDALFIETLHGIIDEDDKVLTDKEIIPLIVKTFGKPTLGANLYHVKYGVLCSIVKAGQEQGETAAKMLLKAMEGTPVSEIPIAKNHYGKAVLNVTTLKLLGIKPNPMALQGVELVKSEE